MKNPTSSNIVKLLALLLLALPPLAPLVRGQTTVTVNSTTVIASATDLGVPLSKVSFVGATGTIEVASGANVLFDSGGASADNRLAVTANNPASFLLDAGSTLTISGNVLATGSGGAIFNGATRLTLAVSDTVNSWYIFANNTASTGNGGALANAVAAATYTLNNVIFRGNYAAGPSTYNATTNGGGAIFNGAANGTFNITNALFDSNTSAVDGGAFASNAPANNTKLTVTSATFQNNVSNAPYTTSNNAGGGAIYAVAGNANSGAYSFTNVLFKGNIAAASGGAIMFQHSSTTNLITGTFTNVLFQSNTAVAGNGGAVSINFTAVDVHTFNDTSFLDNHAALNGGALIFSSTVILHVATSATIAGNTAGNTTTGTGGGDGIFINPTGSPYLSINIDAGARLDMLDPVYASVANTTNIVKTGPGLWNLGGSNTMAPSATGGAGNFIVNAGTLHLYRAGETSGAYAAAAGSITLASGLTTGTFALAAPATLSAGGGNTITAPVINLAASSTIALDLFGLAPGNAPILTLASPSLNGNGWTQTIDLLNATTLGALNTNDTFNLITLTGTTFSSAKFFTLLDAPDPSLYHLQLDSTGSTLQLYYGVLLLPNNVLNWTGAAGNTTWSAANFALASDPAATGTTVATNDIVNLASTTAASTTIAIDAPNAPLAGMNVTGPANYTLTGNPIITSATAGTLSGSVAATGQLVLGASAAPDASALATLPYTGTLTLLNTSNTFTAGIDIRSGALVGNAANLAVGATAAITIATGASLTFDQPTPASYAAPIHGSGTLVKTNTAALTLAANNSAYTGVTTVAAGSLLIPAAAALGGVINVNTGATFGGSGTAGNVTLNNGATLQVGDASASSALPTFTLSALTLNAGSLLAYTGINNQLLVTGALLQNGASTIDLNVGILATGSYSLINAASGFGAFNTNLLGVNYKNQLLVSGSDYLFSIDPATHLLWLTILTAPASGNAILTWNGAAGDAAWLGSDNWNAVALGVTKSFVQGDIVNLDGAASGTLQLAATATLAGMNLSGPASYALAGPGALVTATDAGEFSGSAAATGKLILGANATDPAAAPAYAAFTGTLDLTALTGTNRFAAGIEINTGALRVATAAQLGTTLNNLRFTGADPANAPGTLIIARNSNILLDSAGADTNHLVLTATNAHAEFILEDSATLTIANNNITGAGAVATLNNGANLTLIAGANSQYIFNNNTASGGAGAFSVIGTSTLTLTATNGGSFLFLNGVTTSGRGGAIDANTTSIVTIDHAIFANNKDTAASNPNGGAIGAIMSSTLTLTNVLFTGNSAASGGALFLNSTATGIIRSATFSGNTATVSGGAINIQTAATLNLFDTLLTSNTSTANGGAIGVQTNGSSVFLTDVSLVANTSGTNGGAIYLLNNVNLTYNVSAGLTSQVAGNLAGGAPNGLFYSGALTSTLNVNIAAGGSLDMLDPMGATGAAVLTINKTGAGVWNLGGSTNLGNASANIKFTVAAGTLHLYRTGETSTGPGGTFVTTTGLLTLTGPSSSFILNPGATLSVAAGAPAGAPGPRLSAPAITLAAGSLLAFDVAGATPNTASLLTLSVPALATSSWNQTISLLRLGDLNINDGDAINLLTLSGAPAASLLTPAAFNNLSNITGLYSGYNLAIANSGSTLQLIANFSGITNQVIDWTGAQNPNWREQNWLVAATAAPTPFSRGDIVNFAGPSATTAINVDAPSGVTISGMYVSGTENYTITGQAIVASSSASANLAGKTAATGQLVLGAQAAPDAGAVNTLAYTGTLILSNTSNNFQNGIVINTGALVGNAATLGASRIVDNGSLTFAQTTSATYAAPIAGSGALAKTGTAALTLTANNAAFTGATTVAAGKLLLGAPAALGGTIQVSPAATFGGSGTAGAVTLAPGATLQVGTLNSELGTLNISSLSLSAGSLLDYTNISNTLLASGAVTFAGAGTINLETIATGTYSLITAAGGFTGITPSLLDLTFRGTTIAPSFYTLTTANNQLWLTFLSLPNNVLTWTNSAGDNAWLASANWTLTGGTTVKSFAQGDIVNLSGAAAAAPIQLATTATVAAIYISGSASYALAGAGGIATDPNLGVLAGSPAATGQLVLGKTASAEAGGATTVTAAPFTGVLDLTALTGANHFANGIEIDSGWLRVSNTAQLGITLNQLTFATGLGAITGTSAFAGAGVLNVAAPGGVAFAATMTLDGSHTAANRLAISSSNLGALYLDNAVTLTLANNTATANGGAIALSGNAGLATGGAAGSQMVFSGNSAGGNGGAISIAANALLTLGGTNSGPASLFTGNTAGQGGALYANAAILDIHHATFTANTASGAGGGAITLDGIGNTAITSATFAANTTAGQGGAIFVNNQNTATLQITDALFANNTATGNGGALAAGGIAGASYSWDFTNVSFLGNTSGGQGGAIYEYGSALINYNVTTSATIAGNTASAGAGVYLANNGSPAISFNIYDGARLDMFDPITARPVNATTTSVLKTGSGLWNLGGTTAIFPNNTTAPNNVGMNFTVGEGTLHLYRAGEVSYNGVPVAAGNINMYYTGVPGAAGIKSTFLLQNAATLSAGGGNTITAPAITISASAILALDLLGAVPNDLNTAILTLNATTQLSSYNWTQTLDLLNDDVLTPYNGYTYNLITLAGQGSFSSATSFALAGALPANYTLQLVDANKTLQLLYFTGNAVITWAGTDTTANWRAPNWTNATGPTSFAQGDIVNLAGASATPAITTNLSTPATAAGIYVSGSASYTLTGAGILTTATGSTLTGDTAATGKLVLGAKSAADAGSIITTPFTGTLTLANSANNFTGGIEINTGALIGNAQTLGATAISIAAPGSLTFNQTTSATYAAPITGAGSLAKTGAATLTLAGNSAAFTGTTTVAAGALLLNAASLGGSITVAPAATFGGAGTAGSVTLAASATLQVGAPAAAPTYAAPQPPPGTALAINGPLTLGAGDILNYTSLNNTLHVGSVSAAAGPATINIPDFWQSGTYDLGNLAALYPAAQLLVAGGTQSTDARKQATLTTNAAGDLILTALRDASRAMVWTGSTNTTWTITGADWQGDAATVFGVGDKVTFNDTAPATVQTVTVAAGVIASDMIVSGTSNYTFLGAGITTDAASAYAGDGITPATATGKLTKAGSGTLTLANTAANNFLGGIDLNEGALAISGTTNAATVNVAPASTLQMSGGLLASPDTELAASSTIAGTGTIAGNIALNGLVEAAIAAGNTLTLSTLATSATTTSTNAITGPGAYHKTGGGTLTLSGLGALANTGTTQIDAGAVRLASGTFAAGVPVSATNNLLLNGGTLALAYGSGAANDATAASWTNLHILQSNDPALAAASAITGNNDIVHLDANSGAAFSGTFLPKLTGTLHVAIDATNSTIVLGNLANNFTGIVLADSGTLQITDLRQIAGAGTANATKIALNGGAVEFSAPMTMTGDIQVRPGSSIIAVDDGVALTLTRLTRSATVAISAAVTKAGSGTLTLTGAMQATALTVAEGRWIGVASSDGTPPNNGTVTVNSGAVMQLGRAAAAGGATTTIGAAAGQTYTSTPNGVINSAFAGSGTLEITTGKLILASPQTTIEHINVTGANTAIAVQAATFSPSADSTITLDQSLLVLATNKQTLGNIVLKNNATLAFLLAPGLPARATSIASLTATGGVGNLWFNTDITHLVADHLDIAAPVTGTFAVNVNNIGTAPPNASVNLELIHSPVTTSGTFAIADASREIDIGLFRYTVTGTTTAGAYTVNITGDGDMSKVAAAINTAAAMLPISWFSELDSLTQRLGDLHFENRANKAGFAAWTRGYGEKFNFNKMLTGSGFNERHLGAEAGLDYKLGSAWNIYVGAFMGYGQSQRNYDSATDASNESIYGGPYATLISPNGWYVDAVLKLNRFRNRFAVTDPGTARNAAADYHNQALGASLEIGKRQQLPYDWYITPAAQAATTRVNAKNYATTNGIDIDQASGAATRARIGFTFGRDFETQNYGTLCAYAKAYYGWQWTSGSALTVTLPDGSAPGYFDSRIKGYNLTAGVGLAWQLTKATQLYFDYETTQADYYIRPYGLNLGVRHTW